MARGEEGMPSTSGQSIVWSILFDGNCGAEIGTLVAIKNRTTRLSPSTQTCFGNHCAEVAGRVPTRLAGAGRGQQKRKPSGCPCSQYTGEHRNSAVHAIMQFHEVWSDLYHL